jgi:putative inorganic carbon (hco3(-)) transporter
MGFGLSQYVPLIIYCFGVLVIFLSVFHSPKIGVLYLFPLLPFVSIFNKIQMYPFGKDLNDLGILAVLIGWFIRRRKNTNFNDSSRYLTKEVRILYFSIIFFIVVNLIGLIISLKFGNPQLLANWKNYMLFPVIWFLTYKTVDTSKALKLLSIFLIIGTVVVGYDFFREARWIDYSKFSEMQRDRMTAVFAYLGPNHIAAFLVHYLFIIIGVFIFIKNKIFKLLLISIIPIILFGIIFTFSRGAYIAFLIGMFYLGITKKRIILFFLIIFFISWQTLLPKAVVERVEMTSNQYGELEVSATDRIALWEIAIGMFEASPIIGNGYDSFHALGYSDTHNIYLKFLAELGILGLSSFLLLLFAAFLIGWKAYKDSEDDLFRGLGYGFTACIITVLATNLFGNRWSYLPVSAYLWVLLGMLTRISLINKNNIHYDKS